jgi:hypothetical protein
MRSEEWNERGSSVERVVAVVPRTHPICWYSPTPLVRSFRIIELANNPVARSLRNQDLSVWHFEINNLARFF